MNQQRPGWQYQAVDISTCVEDADPHRLIQMLYEAALNSIAVASGCLERGDSEGKGLAIGKAVGLVGGLMDSLNHDIVDGGLASNLSALYEYTTEQLTLANIDNDVARLDRAREVLVPLKEGWDGIRAESKSLLEATAVAVG